MEIKPMDVAVLMGSQELANYLNSIGAEHTPSFTYLDLTSTNDRSHA